jgi:hypothetical protein
VFVSGSERSYYGGMGEVGKHEREVGRGGRVKTKEGTVRMGFE